MPLLSTRSHSSRRGRISCGRCGERITLTDQIRKDGAGFVHETCPVPPPTIPAQRGR